MSVTGCKSDAERLISCSPLLPPHKHKQGTRSLFLDTSGCIKTSRTPERITTSASPHRMPPAPVSTAMSSLMLGLFLGATSFIWPLAPAASFHLPPCQLINQTVSLEKEGCPKCHPVETTICSGHCVTKDPVIKIPFSNVYQHVCTYRDWHYETFELPDCPPGVNPTVSYPVALSCHCGRCAMGTSDCTFQSLQPNFCMNDIPFSY